MQREEALHHGKQAASPATVWSPRESGMPSLQSVIGHLADLLCGLVTKLTSDQIQVPRAAEIDLKGAVPQAQHFRGGTMLSGQRQRVHRVLGETGPLSRHFTALLESQLIERGARIGHRAIEIHEFAIEVYG